MEVWKHHQWCSLNMWCLMLFGGRGKEQISVLAHQDITYILVQSYAIILAKIVKVVENKTELNWEGWWCWKDCEILKRNHLLTFPNITFPFTQLSSDEIYMIWRWRVPRPIFKTHIFLVIFFKTSNFNFLARTRFIRWRVSRLFQWVENTSNFCLAWLCLI